MTGQREPLRTGAAPGCFLRACAAAAALACGLAVASGASGGGTSHRLLAASAAPPLAALLVGAWVAHRPLLGPAAATALLLLCAAVAPHGPAHLVLAALAFAAAAALAVAGWRGERLAPGAWRDYVALTKPRVMTLLLLTGACGAAVGAHGRPSPALLATTLAGLALACGGAGALNHVLDRDIDRLMGPRTAARPVASGRLAAPRALEFGLALSAASFTLLASAANVLAAVLALVGNLFYVLVYTGYLKRRGPRNIVLGGAAGAVPPLVGYAAATGSVAAPALWLFLLVCLWTPPHFWALALLLKEHYARAEVPMLPVVRGDAATLRRIAGYTALLLAASVVPVATGSFGQVYLAVALVLGGIFFALALRLWRRPSRHGAARLFHYSLLYLALLFIAAAADPLSAGAAAGKPDPRQFLHVDAAARLVHVTLVAGYDGANSGFNFDGYARGELLWTVPLGWRVQVTCTNRGPLRNSCALVEGTASSAVAFRGAATPRPLVGLLPGQTATFTFRASRLGVFRLASLVPGHEAARMYDVLRIAARAAPSVEDLVG
jgi:protoheme IX farnesyltransferase